MKRFSILKNKNEIISRVYVTITTFSTQNKNRSIKELVKENHLNNPKKTNVEKKCKPEQQLKTKPTVKTQNNILHVFNKNYVK